MKFPHVPPRGYTYEFVSFKRNVTAIWICDSRAYVYKNGEHVKSIWGFYDTKKKTYHAPVNAKTIGKEVNVNRTTPYSAMIPKTTILESCFI